MTARRRIIWLALAALGVFGGCARRRAGTRPQVGVTLLTEAHVFYQDLKRGLEQAADSLGLDLHVVAGEWDLARQTSQVESFITQRMDAIVIAPVNSSGIVSAVEEANRAKIPVFTADIAADGGQVVTHVASDNRLLPQSGFESEHRFQKTCDDPEIHAVLVERAWPVDLARQRGWQLLDLKMAEARR